MDVWMYKYNGYNIIMDIMDIILNMDVWMYGCMDVWMYGCMDV